MPIPAPLRTQLRRALLCPVGGGGGRRWGCRSGIAGSGGAPAGAVRPRRQHPVVWAAARFGGLVGDAVGGTGNGWNLRTQARCAAVYVLASLLTLGLLERAARDGTRGISRADGVAFRQRGGQRAAAGSARRFATRGGGCLPWAGGCWWCSCRWRFVRRKPSPCCEPFTALGEESVGTTLERHCCGFAPWLVWTGAVLQTLAIRREARAHPGAAPGRRGIHVQHPRNVSPADAVPRRAAAAGVRLLLGRLSTLGGTSGGSNRWCSRRVPGCPWWRQLAGFPLADLAAHADIAAGIVPGASRRGPRWDAARTRPWSLT